MLQVLLFSVIMNWMKSAGYFSNRGWNVKFNVMIVMKEKGNKKLFMASAGNLLMKKKQFTLTTWLQRRLPGK